MQCCDAIRLPWQPQSVNFLLLYCNEAEVFIPQVIFTFFGEQRTFFYFFYLRVLKKKAEGVGGVKRGLWNMLLVNTSIQRCMLLSETLVILLWNKLIDCWEFSAIASRGVSKLSFGKGHTYLSKGIYINEKCVHCSNLRELGHSPSHSPPPFLSLSFSVSYIQTHSHTSQHIYSTHTPFIPPTVTVKWLNILINCI